jgi:hypothetical protein
MFGSRQWRGSKGWQVAVTLFKMVVSAPADEALLVGSLAAAQLASKASHCLLRCFGRGRGGYLRGQLGGFLEW